MYRVLAVSLTVWLCGMPDTPILSVGLLGIFHQWKKTEGRLSARPSCTS